MNAGRPTRHIEIDLLRTIALFCMVVYHTIFDLSAFYGWSIDPLSDRWRLFARITACLFLLLSGASSAVSFQQKYTSQMSRWKGIGRRFFTIGGVALLITIGTYMFDSERYIRFGILHLIAVSCLLLPITIRLREGNTLLGMLVIGCGFLRGERTIETSLLLPLGLPPLDFTSFDYFPLFPWLGVILVGQGIGSFFYGRQSLNLPSLHTPFWKNLSWPGRHSLLIYLIHQPIILSVLCAIHAVDFLMLLL